MLAAAVAGLLFVIHHPDPPSTLNALPCRRCAVDVLVYFISDIMLVDVLSSQKTIPW
jgi:hypothetical protein